MYDLLLKNQTSLALASMVFLCPFLIQLSNPQELQKKKIPLVCFLFGCFSFVCVFKEGCKEVRKKMYFQVLISN